MRGPNLVKLEQVTRAVLLKEQYAISGVVMREAELRQMLRVLQDSDRQARESCATPGDRSKMIGADLLWRKWQAHRRATLNTELAQVMAQKIEMSHKVRRALGRQSAVEALIKKRKAAKKKLIQKTLEERLLK
jgi:hypothetical protein